MRNPHLKVRLGVDGLLLEDRTQPATISGQVWYDVDGDGVKDAGETGHPGASAYSVELLDGTGTPIDGMYLTSAGTYSFAGVADGSYGVRFNRLTGPYRFSTPGTDSNSVTGGVVVSGGADEALDAGVVGIGKAEGGQASVGGLVYLDLDGDGTKDTGEDGTGGVGVSLRRWNGTDYSTEVDSTTSDAEDGTYSFGSLWAGQFAVVFTAPSGAIITTPLTGGQPVTVGPTAPETVDAGVQPQVVTITSVDTTEGGTGHLVFTRAGGDLDTYLTVYYTVASGTGQATPDTDYTRLAGTTSLDKYHGSVTFAPNQTTGTMDVVTSHDTVYDPDETVSVSIDEDDAYANGDDDSATLTISEDAFSTFTLNGQDGVIWADLPWGSVDPDQASQSLAVSNFAISYAGQTFSEANNYSLFTTHPTAEFAYGEFVGLVFAINTSSVTGYAYSSVSSGIPSGVWTLSAVGGTTTYTVAAAPKEPALVIDFSAFTTGTTRPNITLNVEYKLADNTTLSIAIPIQGATTAGAVRDAVFSVLQDEGLNVTPTGDTRLVIKGTRTSSLTQLSFSVDVPPAGFTGPGLKTTVPSATITPKLFINGTQQ